MGSFSSSNTPSHSDFEHGTRAVAGQVHPRDRKKILLMGATGAGKSTFINIAAGSKLAVGNSLASCTTVVGAADLLLDDGTLVELIDTPGFDDSLRPDIEILEEIAKSIVSWQDIYGIIYLHRISDMRMSGSSRRVFTVFNNLCGDGAMSHVSVVTNMWDRVRYEEGERREQDLLQNPLFFDRSIRAGAKSYRNDNPRETVLKIVKQSLHPTPVQLLIQRELVEQGKTILQTSAGAFLDQGMSEKRVQHQLELDKLNEEYKTALLAQDQESQAEIKHEREVLQQELEEMELLLRRLNQSQAVATKSTRPKEAIKTVVAYEKVGWSRSVMRALGRTMKGIMNDIGKILLYDSNLAPPGYSASTRTPLIKQGL
ncbi:50S ribosome-binding GTPase [Ceratobasidium sp. AG-Ba]|nr:50S ribosome-binding GTPase [Ceratobasidium sp. AG-Ba]